MGFLIRQISEILTLSGAAKKKGRHVQEADLEFLKNQALWIKNGKIQWLGPDRRIPKAATNSKEISAQGKTVLPGFVECHTHSVFAGSRAHEFEKICQGMSYSEISSQGGGILSTLHPTRQASFAELVTKTQKHVDLFSKQGVTTLEIKSGYGLNLKDEIKLLKVAGAMSGPRIVRTFLGAHAKPPEFENLEDYLEELENKYLAYIKKNKLADRVDIFFEKGFFNGAPAVKYLRAARKLGLDLVIHADQLSLSGGSEVAISLGALSADHLIQVREPEINKLANSEVTCVLLPAADLYLRCPYPPARKLIDAGARVALATDFNPGSSPTQDLALIGLLARLEMKMSLPEVISAYTVGAAHALNLATKVGSLEVGKYADFLITEKSWTDLFYSVGQMGPFEVYQQGQKLNDV
ncbi:MAG: imidazolonepropionase [Bdellovibrionales bacterium]|nr:imidazolonepropionase [Bdellovibrionales bacterium]